MISRVLARSSYQKYEKHTEKNLLSKNFEILKNFKNKSFFSIPNEYYVEILGQQLQGYGFYGHVKMSQKMVKMSHFLKMAIVSPWITFG